MSDKPPLYFAIENGRTEVVKILLDNGSLLRGRKSYANQLLFDASRAGSVGVIAFLLDHGAEVNALTPLRDPYGESGPPLSEGHETPLHKACFKGNVDALRVLIERGAKVNARDKQGTAPLHELGYLSSPDAAALLFDCGADLNAVNKSGSTALHEAASNGNRKLSRFLLDHGVKPDVQNNSGCTPLHLACDKGYYELCMLLVERGADVNMRSGHGVTPLMEAASYYHFPELVDFLLKKGADVNARSERGDTALHGASAAGDTDIIKKLLRRGAKVNVANESGDTPLHEAVSASKNGPKAVSLLLSAGADLRPSNHYFGNTPLHQAAMKGSVEIAKALVRHGAEVDARNKDGLTTWEEAYRFGRDDDADKVHDYLKSKSRAARAVGGTSS